MRLGQNFFWALSCSLLFACGGGGGGNGSGVNNSSGQQSSSSVSTLQPITRQSAPSVAGAFVDTFDFAANIPHQLYQELQLYSQLTDGVHTSSCQNPQGALSISRSNQGRLIEERYDNCQLDGFEINGERKISVASLNAQSGATISYTYKRMVMVTLDNPKLKQTWDGTVNYTGGSYGYADNDSFFDLSVNLVVDDSRDGYLEIKNLQLHQQYKSDLLMVSPNFNESLAGIQTILGELVLRKSIRFTIEQVEHGVVLKGDKNSRVIITKEESLRLLVGWDENGDGLADARVVMPDMFEFSISDLVAKADHKTVAVLATNKKNQIYEGAQLYMVRGAAEDVYIYWNFSSTSASLLTYEVNGKTTNGTEWVQVDAGHFRFAFDSNTVDTNYDLIFTATDINGNKSPEIHAKIYVGVDSDKDGIPDVGDPNDDNDELVNKFDAFPLDPRETRDSDGDGIGDNADPDADFSVQRGFVWFVDKDGVMYYTANLRHLYPEYISKYFSKRWDIKTSTFLPELSMQNYLPGYNYYSKETHRLYYTSSKNDIYYMDLDRMQETLFVKSNVSLQIVKIEFATKDFVVVGRTTNMGTVYESYDVNGQLISSMPERQGVDKVPFYKPDVALFCKYYLTIDADGKFYQQGTSAEQRDNCAFNAFPQVSLDGRYVYKHRSANGNPAGLYAIEGNLIKEQLLSNVHWLSTGLIGVNEGVVSLYNVAGEPIKQFILDAEAIIKSSVAHEDYLVLVLQLANAKPKIIVLDAGLNLVSEY